MGADSGVIVAGVPMRESAVMGTVREVCVHDHTSLEQLFQQN